jgi:hypothetical protein
MLDGMDFYSVFASLGGITKLQFRWLKLLLLGQKCVFICWLENLIGQFI